MKRGRAVAPPLALPCQGPRVSAPAMMIKETSLRGDPDLRGELAFLARGCDFVLPSRFKKRLKSFQQQQVSPCWEPEEPGPSLDVHANSFRYRLLIPFTLNVRRVLIPEDDMPGTAGYSETLTSWLLIGQGVKQRGRGDATAVLLSTPSMNALKKTHASYIGHHRAPAATSTLDLSLVHDIII